jgi:HEAT repeat protein
VEIESVLSTKKLNKVIEKISALFILTALILLMVGCSSSGEVNSEDAEVEDIESLILNLSEEREIAEESSDALVTLGEAAVDPLITALAESQAPASERIVYALGEIGDPRAVEPLIASFMQGSAGGELLALEKIGDPRAVEAAVFALVKDYDHYKNVAERMIAAMGTESVEPWVNLLESDDPEVRLSAITKLYFEGIGVQLENDYASLIEALIQQQILAGASYLENQNEIEFSRLLLEELSFVALESLIDVLQGEDENMRFPAAGAIGANASDAAIEALVAALSSSDQMKSLAGMDGLAEMFWSSGADRVDLGPGFENLAAHLLNPELNEGIRSQALFVMVKSHDPRAGQVLIDILESGDTEYPEAEIVDALGDTGNPEALPTILQYFNNEDEDIQLAVVKALGDIGGPTVLDYLIEAIQDDDHDIERAALASLNKLDDETLAPLLRALDDQDLEMIAKAHLFFISRAPAGRESLLTRALMAHGDKDMAMAYLSSGHEPLEYAARQWAEENGYTVIEFTVPAGVGGAVQWGSGN